MQLLLSHVLWRRALACESRPLVHLMGRLFAHCPLSLRPFAIALVVCLFHTSACSSSSHRHCQSRSRFLSLSLPSNCLSLCPGQRVDRHIASASVPPCVALFGLVAPRRLALVSVYLQASQQASNLLSFGRHGCATAH